MPPERVRQALAETGKASARERDLPAQLMVYDAIALALYMGSSRRAVLRCLLEGLRWLWSAAAVKVAGKSEISQARRQLGEAPRRRLYAGLAQPIATRASKGAWYRDGRLVSLEAPAWRWPMLQRTGPNLAGQEPAAARALSRNCVCGAGGERHARAVRRPSGALWRG
jgi:hypothetical protein